MRTVGRERRDGERAATPDPLPPQMALCLLSPSPPLGQREETPKGPAGTTRSHNPRALCKSHNEMRWPKATPQVS